MTGARLVENHTGTAGLLVCLLLAGALLVAAFLIASGRWWKDCGDDGPLWTWPHRSLPTDKDETQ